jgi:DNA mismatch endonuclease (patch repair protein)
MTDIVAPGKRSLMMANIQGKNTKPELTVRKILFSQGFRYRLHRRDLPGVPDIVFPKKKIALFIHGCFWHQHSKCKFAKFPSSNTEFWREKLSKNIERDRKNVNSLIAQGWRVLTIWECETKNLSRLVSLEKELITWMNGMELQSEIPRRSTNSDQN